MTTEKLFSVLKGSYHDGTLLNARYSNNTLYVYCHRNPPDPDKKEDSNTKYVIIRFDNVTDLKVYDWRGTEKFIPYEKSSFCKPDGFWAISGITFLACEDGLVEFGESLQFRADGVVLLANSSEELDFSKYCGM